MMEMPVPTMAVFPIGVVSTALWRIYPVTMGWPATEKTPVWPERVRAPSVNVNLMQIAPMMGIFVTVYPVAI